ncbi:MAG: DNA mismatch repair endonuclease MutL [Jaaginema sp. PMC 1079.18]|nr:DNA mismatch repair endonuclease MutL [Jaaginema sp. PMC 1080.18]MEC4851899.1 DNA mismatch repair endonuclease MutL [Jaaginema sp. PMC 1079.18]MEC4865219.1 DNA mismatch repair endonuclease MutL [Jaaginema sp. PMC 1078.18]
MSIKIQPLPTEVIDLIAAGEVIDSLAAAIRELAENAIDAKATRITITINLELWQIQIADNGEGMDLDNLRECAKPHCTSKIASCDDLWRITSLGFRGEALHSLAQLSNLDISSRVQDSDEPGWRLAYDRYGEPIEEEITAIAPGTIILIDDLFGNVPVRRKGLPSKNQQLKSIQETIQQLALCHPQITWQVQQETKAWFSLNPGTNAGETLPQILKQVQVSDLQTLSKTIDIPVTQNSQLDAKVAQLDLILGLPDRCHRRRPDWIKVAVNGRFVRIREIEQTMISSFARALPRDRYPIVFSHLQVPPHQIDWNRHPAKTEIYLQEINFWRETINQTIEQALRLSPVDLESQHHQRISTLIKAAEPTGSYRLQRQVQTSPKSDLQNLIELRAVAQVSNTYIVAEHPNGVWLIEQHIAHERVLYEQLVKSWQLVSIEPPLVLTELTAKQLTQLQRLGLEVEAFGDEMWAIRTIPQMLQNRPDISDAILELSLGGDLQTAQVATACRSAIRNGTPLDLEAMQALLNQWQQTRNPRTCPHGRPIYLPLEESALARFFRRHWVIGKSHGI